MTSHNEIKKNIIAAVPGIKERQAAVAKLQSEVTAIEKQGQDYAARLQILKGQIAGTDAVLKKTIESGGDPNAEIAKVRRIKNEIEDIGQLLDAVEAARDTKIDALEKIRVEIAHAFHGAACSIREQLEGDLEKRLAEINEVVETWPGIINDAASEIGITPLTIPMIGIDAVKCRALVHALGK